LSQREMQWKWKACCVRLVACRLGKDVVLLTLQIPHATVHSSETFVA
jgi:hypothetical protein